jgi:hypothetical protein
MLKLARVAVCSLAASLGACAIAPIALPTELALAERLDITGMGFGERGRLAVGASSGTFYRHSLKNRRRDFGSPGRITSYAGDSGFDVQGPDLAGSVMASCIHFEQEVGTRSFSVTTEPFSYRCRFMRNGTNPSGELLLHSAPRAVGPLLAETRTGRMSLGGNHIAIEPIHTSPGLKVPTSEPLGYRFLSGGRVIGAVDLNSERKTIYVPRTSPDERQAVLIGSLALSVLWIA